MCTADLTFATHKPPYSLTFLRPYKLENQIDISNIATNGWGMEITVNIAEHSADQPQLQFTNTGAPARPF